MNDKFKNLSEEECLEKIVEKAGVKKEVVEDQKKRANLLLTSLVSSNNPLLEIGTLCTLIDSYCESKGLIKSAFAFKIYCALKDMEELENE